jgi:hypothetical protein
MRTLKQRKEVVNKAWQLKTARLFDGSFSVEGTSGTYIVHLDGMDAQPFSCTCTAGKFGRLCSHAISAQRHARRLLLPNQHVLHPEREKPVATTSPRRFSPTRPSSNYESAQPVLVENGLYYGFFRMYREPKMVNKYQSTEQELKIYLEFLVTHGLNEKQLPHITIAGAFVPYKWFYSPDNGMVSRYFEFEHALCAKDYATKQALYDTPDEQRLDLDGLIGRPAMLEVEKWEKANNDGIFNLGIKSLKQIPSSARKELERFYKTFEFDMSDKGLKRIAKPTPEYEDDSSSATFHGAKSDKYAAPSRDEIPMDDEVPF